LKRLEGRQVVIIGNIPEIGFRYSKVKARYLWANRDNIPLKAEIGNSNGFFEENNIQIHDISTYFCSDNLCDLEREGNIIFRDGDHLSKYGGELLAPFFKQFLNL